MTRRSLRLRLMLLAALLIGATLTIAGLTLVWIFERHIERRVAQELETRMIELAAAFVLGPDGEPTLSRPLSDPRYRQPYSGAYWQISRGAEVVLRSRSLWDEEMDPSGADDAAPRAVERAGPERSTLYVLERDVTVARHDLPDVFRLAVALDHAEVRGLGTAFGRDVAMALGLLGTVLFLGTWLQSTLGLQPLRALRKELALIRDGRLARLPGCFPDEVAPLAQDLNRLLDRQDDLLRKARQRAGDLAHGLKTPLAILAAEARQLELAGRVENARTLEEQIAAMGRHVERELARARTSGAMTSGVGVCEPRTLVERLFGLMRRMPRGGNLEWCNEVPLGLRLAVDPDDLAELLGNFLDNARKWAGSRIVVQATALGGEEVRLVVADDGPGIPEGARGRLVERGERAEHAGDGSGLGLAIARDVLAAYGASYVIEDEGGRGCRVVFRLRGWAEPRATPDDRTRERPGEAQGLPQPSRPVGRGVPAARPFAAPDTLGSQV